MKSKFNLITVSVCIFGATLLISSNAFSQGNSNGNANSNNNANGNALKWKTQGNNADTSDFIGTTNPTDLKLRTNNEERLRITKDGNVGIGISNPLQKFEIQGNIRLTGDAIFSDYADQADTLEKFLFVDKNGKTMTKKMTNVQNIIYSVDCFIGKEDNGFGGSTLVTLPSWASTIFDNRQVLYTGVNCPTWVGIGTQEPLTRLDVRGAGRFDRGIGIGDVAVPEAGLHLQNFTLNSTDPIFETLIIVENENNQKVLQLDNDGLLRAREIKVDEAAWPDYVFKPNYELMPLNKVKEFIAQNGHLPNVPSAEEVEADGVNIGKTARITMEKVEELTLYLIEQQEELEKQKELLAQQQKLIEAQQRLLVKQQSELDKINKKTK